MGSSGITGETVRQDAESLWTMRAGGGTGLFLEGVRRRAFLSQTEPTESFYKFHTKEADSNVPNGGGGS